MCALLSQAMRKVTGSLSKSQCTVVFLNQLRSKIGVIYGSPEVTSGEPVGDISSRSDRFRGGTHVVCRSCCLWPKVVLSWIAEMGEAKIVFNMPLPVS